MHPLVKVYLNHLKLPVKSPTFQFLCELQSTHIETIPHENINGIFNFHTSFDIPFLLNKFINEKRGGMCFELNYAFAWLLHELGFKVELILSNVVAYEHNRENNAYPTHPVIIVYFGDATFLADVGWSDAYRNPLSLSCMEYSDSTGKYRVSEKSSEQFVMEKWLKSDDSAAWFEQFIFNKPTQPLEEFTYPQGFLASHAFTHVGKNYLFTNLFHFTKVERDGHCTLWGDRFFTRQGIEKNSKALSKDIPSTLQDEFNVAPYIAKKCVKPRRSMSMLFPYKPVSEEEFKEMNQIRPLFMKESQF